jgi:CDP-6-deoxy-D-xylo-4-hexulose-3-dehydrase
MEKSGIEFRRGSSGGGNQLRQPYLKQFLKHYSLSDFPEAEHIHFFGWYLGNFPDLPNKTILEICEIVNTA